MALVIIFNTLSNSGLLDDHVIIDSNDKSFEKYDIDQQNSNTASQRVEIPAINDGENDDRPEVVRTITPAPLPAKVEPGKEKLIYFASNFFGGPFHFDELPKQCKTTYDPKDLQKADAVVVHALGGSPMPEMHSEEGRRKLGVPQDQVWVGMMYESAGIYSHLPGVYNYTMTFRTDSDIYSPYCGRFDLASKGSAIADKEPKLETFRKKRKKMVAWMVSNCHAANFRMDYATELSKHISVDIYGACSPNGLRCTRFGSGGADRACWEMVAENYKFYLAFESSHCKDYITEKFFTPMYYGVVPIVYGGSSVHDYEMMAPKNSFIDTRNYKTPKGNFFSFNFLFNFQVSFFLLDLADYLKKLDKSEDEYEAFFKWRTRYMVHYNRTFVGQDILCAKLWNLDKYRNSYSEKELNTWWVDGAKCVPPPYKPSEKVMVVHAHT